MFGGLGIIIYCLVLMGFIGALAVALVFSIIKRSKLGVVASALPLICTLYWLFTDPFNMWGLLTREPAPLELVAEYQLAPAWSSYLAQMGYKKMSGSITLKSDASFWAKDIPACCVHGGEENEKPSPLGYYSFHGTWKISKSEAVYGVVLSVFQITGENIPSDSEWKIDQSVPVRVIDLSTLQVSVTGTNIRSRAELSRNPNNGTPHRDLTLRIMRGNPLSVGFAFFSSGDYEYIEFSRKQPEPGDAANAVPTRG